MQIPFPTSASPHARHPRATAYREGSTSSGESPRSRSSHGSSDLIFPMDPPTPPERRTRYQSYAGGQDQRCSPPSSALPQLVSSLSMRCRLCDRQFTPRSDYAARMRMCDDCRVPTRRPAQGTAATDAHGVPTQRPRRNGAPPFQFVSQGTLAPPVVTRTGRYEQYTMTPTPGTAPVAQQSRTGSGPPLCSILLSSAEQQPRRYRHWSRLPRRPARKTRQPLVRGFGLCASA